MNKTVIYLLLFISLLGYSFCLPAVNAQSSPLKKSTITLTSNKTTINTGEEFTVSVSIDSRDYSLNIAEINIKYPKELVQITHIDQGSYMYPNPTMTRDEAGYLGLTVFPRDRRRIKGSGTVAEVSFKALKGSPVASIEIDQAHTSALSNEGEAGENVIGDYGPLVNLVLTQDNTPLEQKPGLSLLLSKSFVESGEEFNIDVLIFTNSVPIQAADINIVFPKEYLEAVSVTQKSFFNSIDRAATLSPGRITLRYSDSSNTNRAGNGTLATIRMRAVQGGYHEIKFDNLTALTQKDTSTNKVGTMVPQYITVNGAAFPYTMSSGVPFGLKISPTNVNVTIPQGSQKDILELTFLSTPYFGFINDYEAFYKKGIKINRASKDIYRDIKIGETIPLHVEVDPTTPPGTYTSTIILTYDDSSVYHYSFPMTVNVISSNVTIPADQITSLPANNGDINHDNIVNIQDYNILVTQFNQTGQDLSADFNNSGKVDIQDFNILVSNFMK